MNFLIYHKRLFSRVTDTISSVLRTTRKYFSQIIVTGPRYGPPSISRLKQMLPKWKMRYLLYHNRHYGISFGLPYRNRSVLY